MSINLGMLIFAKMQKMRLGLDKFALTMMQANIDSSLRVTTLRILDSIFSDIGEENIQEIERKREVLERYWKSYILQYGTDVSNSYIFMLEIIKRFIDIAELTVRSQMRELKMINKIESLIEENTKSISGTNSDPTSIDGINITEYESSFETNPNSVKENTSSPVKPPEDCTLKQCCEQFTQLYPDSVMWAIYFLNELVDNEINDGKIDYEIKMSAEAENSIIDAFQYLLKFNIIEASSSSSGVSNHLVPVRKTEHTVQFLALLKNSVNW